MKFIKICQCFAAYEISWRNVIHHDSSYYLLVSYGPEKITFLCQLIAL